MKNHIPKYLINLIKKNTQIKSGRKNYQEQHNRITKQINLIKKYFKQSN